MLPLSKLDCPYCRGVGGFSFGSSNMVCSKCEGDRTLLGAVREFAKRSQKDVRLTREKMREIALSRDFQVWIGGPLKEDK